MRISEIYNLGKQQPELDFVDIDTAEDLQLFLDPYFLGNRKDPWSRSAAETIRSFFQEVVSMIRRKDPMGPKLFHRLTEPNETCLGLSQGRPQGRGVGQVDAVRIYGSLSKSKAVTSGVVDDLEDCHIFVHNFGKDKLSDMTTNIIRNHLIEYTQEQCKLLGIPLHPGVSSGYYWDDDQGNWNAEHTEMLVVDGKKILLVPKGIVSFSKIYTPDRYYSRFILEHLRNEYVTLGNVLVKERKDGTPYVTKASIRNKKPYSKEFLLEFTQRNPKVFNKFRSHSRKELTSLTDQEIIPTDIPGIIDHLVAKLRRLPTGQNHATTFHHTIMGILELVFYPDLINPRLESPIHEGRKRIDIRYDNAADTGFFAAMPGQAKVAARFIYAECKNYSSDPMNPELDQLSGRFSPARGELGLLVCRHIENMDLFLERCNDTYKDGRGLIIPLVDDDLIQILCDIKERDAAGKERSTLVNDLLKKRCRKLLR